MFRLLEKIRRLEAYLANSLNSTFIAALLLGLNEAFVVDQRQRATN